MNLLRRLKPIIVKEFRQIRRDRRVLLILIVVPALQLLINGYAMNFDVQHIRMAVYDQERSAASRDFVNSFVTSGYFDYVDMLSSSKEATDLLDNAKIKCALIIPDNFSRELSSGEPIDIQVLVDGSESNTASTIVGYVQVVALDYSQGIILHNLAKIGRGNYIPLQLQARIWYNPELKSAKFLVPGMIGFILALTGVIATALSIVKEKERNTIEQIDVSPISPLQLIIGKTIPYALISLVAAALVLLAAYFMFDVVIKGSIILLFFSTLLFIICALSIGIFVSTISENQQVAFQLASLASMLPTIMLSGFMFPIRSMPWWLQVISNITPAKFYLVILRSIILKGVGVSAFWQQLVYLAIFCTFLLTVSARKFRKTLG